MSNPTQTMTLADFLLARIAEDEAVARAAIEDDGGSDKGFSGEFSRLIAPPSGVGYAAGGFGEAAARMISTYAVPARVLAECAAKRAIVEDYATLDADYRTTRSKDTEARRFQALISLARLAGVYADHPDWREDWRP